MTEECTSTGNKNPSALCVLLVQIIGKVLPNHSLNTEENHQENGNDTLINFDFL